MHAHISAQPACLTDGWIARLALTPSTDIHGFSRHSVINKCEPRCVTLERSLKNKNTKRERKICINLIIAKHFHIHTTKRFFQMCGYWYLPVQIQRFNNKYLIHSRLASVLREKKKTKNTQKAKQNTFLLDRTRKDATFLDNSFSSDKHYKNKE